MGLFGADSPVTVLLLVAIVMVSGFALFADPTLIDRLGFRPTRVAKEPYRYITGGFVHVSLTHLAFNAITLYFFGPALEARMGSVDYLILYVGALLCAHVLTHFQHRGNSGYNAVGASGAISGVLFCYVLFTPYDWIYVFAALPIPAVLFAFLFVAGSIYAMKSGRSFGIAHEAHLGGAMGGLLLAIVLEPGILPRFFDQLF